MPTTRSQRASAPMTRPRRVLGSINADLSSTPERRSPKKEQEVSQPECSPSPLPEKRRRVSTLEEGPQNSAVSQVRLVCRDQETASIAATIAELIAADRSGSMYISGAPGTGKTAVVRHVCAEQLPPNCRAFYVNCMRVDSPNALAQAILRETKGGKGGGVKEDGLEAVEKHLSRQAVHRPVVLVLDEMDALVHSHQETLYRLFDWPGRLPCRLVLLCIANSLDLTDRLLPRLKGRAWRPTLLHFKPYSHDQLARIVESRMTAESPDTAPTAIDATAVQLCARKVAASTGDARAAIDICRRSVELAGGSPAAPASVGHVSRALRDAAGSSPSALPLQQKLCLAAALLLNRREFSLGALLDRYAGLCRDRHLPEVEAGEFAGVCQLLEARGLINIRRAKETRLHKLSLKLDERSVRRSIDDPALMASVLAAAGERKWNS